MCIDEFQDGSLRSKVGSDFEHSMGVSRGERILGNQVRSHICAAKTVDRLFGITHEKQRTGAECSLLPLARSGTFARESPKNFGLQRVSILELIHQNPWVTFCYCSANRLVVPEKIAGMMKQIVEIE